MNNYPLISIIITTYNCELNIENTIKSAISQSYKNIEIIIVDDNSSDSTLDKCKKYENLYFIKIIKNNFIDPIRIHKGVNINAGYSTRNLGIKYAKGEWISFIDGGDCIHKLKLEMQMKAAMRYKCLHVLSSYKTFDKNKTFYDYNSLIESNLDNVEILSTKHLLKVLKKQKDLLSNIPTYIRKNIPIYLRQSFKLRRIIYPAPMDPFPGCGPSVFFNKTISTKYRSLKERKWSSAKGRGADRDFNFNVLETYKSSVIINSPLYYWGV